MEDLLGIGKVAGEEDIKSFDTLMVPEEDERDEISGLSADR